MSPLSVLECNTVSCRDACADTNTPLRPGAGARWPASAASAFVSASAATSAVTCAICIAMGVSHPDPPICDYCR
jgi:hypothetical protein